MTEYSQFSTYCDLLREKTKRSPAMICGRCEYWYPDDLRPSLGQCQRKDCEYFQRALPEDRVSDACFEERSLAPETFAWCRECRETIPVSEISLHVGHNLYVATAPYPVEDAAELTFAGD